MRPSPRVTIVVVLLAAAIAGGAIAALSAGGSKPKPALQIQNAGANTTATSTAATSTKPAGAPAHHAPRPLLASAASYLGVSSARLREELRGGKSLAQIAKETPGKSEAGLIAAVDRQRLTKASKRLQRRVAAQVRAPGGRLKRRILTLREDALSYLGLTSSELRSEQRSKTLAQIAQSTAGKSEAGLREAIYNARKQQLEAAVSAGTISATVESHNLARLPTLINAYMHRTLRSSTSAVFSG